MWQTIDGKPQFNWWELSYDDILKRNWLVSTRYTTLIKLRFSDTAFMLVKRFFNWLNTFVLKPQIKLTGQCILEEMVSYNYSLMIWLISLMLKILCYFSKILRILSISSSLGDTRLPFFRRNNSSILKLEYKPTLHSQSFKLK